MSLHYQYNHNRKVSSGYTHWAALTKMGDVFTCSTGDDGYGGFYDKPFYKVNKHMELGRDVKGDDAMRPGRVPLPSAAIDVGTNRIATYVILADGKVVSFGGHPYLGRGKGTGPKPEAVAGMEGKAVSVAGGEYFTVAATSAGLFTSGGNAYKTLGVAGRKEDSFHAFIKAEMPPGLDVRRVVAGYQHAFALVSTGKQQQQQQPTTATATTVTSIPTSVVKPQTTQTTAASVTPTTTTSTVTPKIVTAASTTTTTRVPLTREQALAYLAQVRGPVKSVAAYWREWRQGLTRPPTAGAPSHMAVNNLETLRKVVDSAAKDIWEVLENVQFNERYASLLLLFHPALVIHTHARASFSLSPFTPLPAHTHACTLTLLLPIHSHTTTCIQLRQPLLVRPLGLLPHGLPPLPPRLPRPRRV